VSGIVIALQRAQKNFKGAARSIAVSDYLVLLGDCEDATVDPDQRVVQTESEGTRTFWKENSVLQKDGKVLHSVRSLCSSCEVPNA
jgi:hypothetical protein